MSKPTTTTQSQPSQPIQPAKHYRFYWEDYSRQHDDFMSDDLEVNDLSLKGVFVGFKKEKINLNVEASTNLNYCADTKSHCLTPLFKATGSAGPVDFESNATLEDGSIRKVSDVKWAIGEKKDLSFSLFWNSNSLRSATKSSMNSKVHLRTNWKNLVVSAGVEDFDVLDETNRLPKVGSLQTSYIHDLNKDLRLYGGLNLAVNLHPFNIGRGHLLAGFNYLRKYRVVVVGGGNFCDVVTKGDASKNEADKTERKICSDLRVLGTAKINSSLLARGELNLSKGCCEGEELKKCATLAAEYEVDSKTRLKAKADCTGGLVVSYLHSYGVCNFGFVSRVNASLVDSKEVKEGETAKKNLLLKYKFGVSLTIDDTVKN